MTESNKVYLAPDSEIITKAKSKSLKDDSYTLGYIVQMMHDGADLKAIKDVLASKGYTGS